MSYMPPRIRLEVEGMRHQVMHHLQQYHTQVEEAVDKQVQAAIENFNFEAAVSEAVHKILQDSIKAYYGYGEGYRAIERAVWDSLDAIHGKGKEGEDE